MSDDAYRNVMGLRAVRGYRDEPIPDDEVEAILQAGRWTGSAKNVQPWAFVVVRSPEQREAVAACGNFTTPIRNAPLVVALVGLPGGYEFDIGRLAQNMMLAAAARGIGSCPVTLHDEACAHRVLGVPEDHGCRYAIAFGYPDEEEAARLRRRLGSMVPSGRTDLGSLVREERFGH
jgi:nitroreductase